MSSPQTNKQTNKQEQNQKMSKGVLAEGAQWVALAGVGAVIHRQNG